MSDETQISQGLADTLGKAQVKADITLQLLAPSSPPRFPGQRE